VGGRRGIIDAHPGRNVLGRQFVAAARHLAAEINIQLRINCVVLSHCWILEWEGQTLTARTCGIESMKRLLQLLIFRLLSDVPFYSSFIGVGAQSTLGGRHFCPKIYMHEKLTKCPNFT